MLGFGSVVREPPATPVNFKHIPTVCHFGDVDASLYNRGVLYSEELRLGDMG